MIDCLPANSQELEESSAARKDYTRILSCIFNALELTGSGEILETVVLIVCRDKQFFMIDDVAKTLEGCFLK